MSETGPGRPTALTPEVQAKVLEAIAMGNYRVTAAQYAGIGEQTFKDWMSRGLSEPDSEYAKFRSAVLDAEAKVEVLGVGVISDASTRDPKRLLEFLARKFPDRWASDTARVRRLEREMADIKGEIRELLRSLERGRNAGPERPGDAASPDSGASETGEPEGVS